MFTVLCLLFTVYCLLRTPVDHGDDGNGHVHSDRVAESGAEKYHQSEGESTAPSYKRVLKIKTNHKFTMAGQTWWSGVLYTSGL
jgi:hypothetical protein